MNKIIEIIKKSWSKETSKSALWNKDKAYYGQDDVTSLIINDLFGGTIMHCMAEDNNHYYNIINNKIVDLTATFLEDKIDYNNSIEKEKNSLLSNVDIRKRYVCLLNIVYNILSSNLFETIDMEGNTYKKYLNDIAFYSTFEIDRYTENKNEETIVFDLAAQDTENIYCYTYNKNTRIYRRNNELCSYTNNNKKTDLPPHLLEAIFSIARKYKKEFESQAIIKDNIDKNYKILKR